MVGSGRGCVGRELMIDIQRTHWIDAKYHFSADSRAGFSMMSELTCRCLFMVS